MISGFSRLTKQEKVQQLQTLVKGVDISEVLQVTRLSDAEVEELIHGFSENVIGSFPFPYAVAPNFLIDGKEYAVPMVTEESSVVAAAAKSAKFWYTRGGFQTEIKGCIKKGHVHFLWKGSKEVFAIKFQLWKPILLDSLAGINANMAKRGGGIKDIILLDRTDKMPGLLQLEASFDTQDAMGANFINTCLEQLAAVLQKLVEQDVELASADFDIVMRILSNYSPENRVRVFVTCPIKELKDAKTGLSGEAIALKFKTAVDIACIDTNRAVTHNKGIFNGTDAVTLATGNDWRAIEANGHAYASKDGLYRSLSSVSLSDKEFIFEMEIPMQVGVVGGVTSLHPLTKFSLQIMGNPSASELMKIIASAGLASNFAAIKSLVTTGIQKGHMAMHLTNILTSLQATASEKEQAKNWFTDKIVSYSAVEAFLKSLSTK